MKLGRVKSKNDPRNLHIHNYVQIQSLPVPPAHDMINRTKTWPMLANDKYNCCTSAAAGHMVHHWTEENQHNVFLTDADVIQSHSRLTGNHLLEPVSMLEALKLWRNTGIGKHQIHSFLSAGHANPDHLRAIIFLFGGAYIGMDLPNFAFSGSPEEILSAQWETNSGRSPDDAAPRIENGHCVAAIGYDENAIYVVTWGLIKPMSWDFFTTYNDEAFAVLSTDWVEEDRKAPSGFSLQALEDDITMATSQAAQ